MWGLLTRVHASGSLGCFGGRGSELRRLCGTSRGHPGSRCARLRARSAHLAQSSVRQVGGRLGLLLVGANALENLIRHSHGHAAEVWHKVHTVSVTCETALGTFSAVLFAKG